MAGQPETDITKAKIGDVWQFSWDTGNGIYTRTIAIYEIDNKTLTGIISTGPNENKIGSLDKTKSIYSWKRIRPPTIVREGGRPRRKSKRRKSKRRKTRSRRN